MNSQKLIKEYRKLGKAIEKHEEEHERLISRRKKLRDQITKLEVGYQKGETFEYSGKSYEIEYLSFDRDAGIVRKLGHTPSGNLIGGPRIEANQLRSYLLGKVNKPFRKLWIFLLALLTVSCGKANGSDRARAERIFTDQPGYSCFIVRDNDGKGVGGSCVKD